MLNIQSPLTNCSYLLGYENFLLALYDYPGEVHTLLDMVTDLMIEFVVAERELVSDFVPALCYPDWVPDGFGIGVAEDLAAVLSPGLYEEFALPYNNRLSESFNGICIHSCGKSQHNWDVMLKLENLRSVNFELPDNSLEKMVDTFTGKTVLAPHAPFRRRMFATDSEYVRYLLARKKPDTALFITVEREIPSGSGPAMQRESEADFAQVYALLQTL